MGSMQALRRMSRLLCAANVRTKRVTTAGRVARDGESLPRKFGPGQVACHCHNAGRVAVDVTRDAMRTIDIALLHEALQEHCCLR
jgi:hypothetical protein